MILHDSKCDLYAELDNDIDDAVAAHYLLSSGRLSAILPDPMPETRDGKDRLGRLTSLGAAIIDEIPGHCPLVVVGGRFTSVARAVSRGTDIEVLVANAGFAGRNFVDLEDALPKFAKRDRVRTFNFNLAQNRQKPPASATAKPS